jgi:hydrogenase/urease accessory protein HupE
VTASRSRGLAGFSAAALIVAASGQTGAAHEIGTTRVSARLLEERRYEIEVVTDATALLEKLEASADRPTRASDAADGGLAERLSALSSFDDIFRRRVSVRFDDREVRPRIEYSVVPPGDELSPAVATIRLSGEMPPGARAFAWNYSWTFASYALLIESEAIAAPTTIWLEGGQTSAPFVWSDQPRRSSPTDVAWRHFVLGFTHIVPKGLDHVLFVLGIVLLNRRASSLVAQISAFTAAHSVTLGLATFDVLTVSPSVVEPMIAVSIAYVAIENIFVSEVRPWRIALVFGFGLLHGMGFAEVLREVGLRGTDLVTALVTFNVGVEAGQLAVVGIALALVGWTIQPASYRRLVVVPTSVSIAATAVYWTFERLQ